MTNNINLIVHESRDRLYPDCAAKIKEKTSVTCFVVNVPPVPT